MPSDKAPLLLLTWNLRSNAAAFEIACSYLAARTAAGNLCIGAFQEPPSSLGAAALAEGKVVVRTRPVSGVHPKNVVVTSNEIVFDVDGRHEYEPMIDDQRRCEGFTIGSTDWFGVRVLAVHAWDRQNHSTETERTKWAALLRGVVSKFWSTETEARRTPMVVLGDLNANPWDAEITSRDGLFAVRTKDRRLGEEAKVANRAAYSTPLFNPMWRLLGHDDTFVPQASQAQGTLHYPSNDLAWHLFDQIVVSDDLRERIANLRVIHRLGGNNLVDEQGRPLRDRIPKSDGKWKYVFRYSDHLPTEMLLHRSPPSLGGGGHLSW